MALVNFKICPNCGKQLALSATFCPACGQCVSNVQTPINNERLRPNVPITEAVILGLASFICCTIWALPFAIISYVKSKDAEQYWMMGNVYEAQVAADKAQTHLRIGFWVAVIPIIISVVVGIILLIGLGVLGANL